MYNVVLASMLLAGGEATTWHCHGCCGGCYGCHGVSYPGYNYGCSGCRGCHGCFGWAGSWCHGCHCSGCSGCWGCHGCSGCSGCWGYSACAGCYGSWGYAYYGGCTCNGSFCNGGVVVAMPACYGCHGGGSGCCGGVYAQPPGQRPVMPPAADLQPRTKAEEELIRKTLKELREQLEKARKEQKQEETQAPTSPAPARVTVNLPGDARLWVDQVECPLTSDVRSFSTPALQPGQTYFYTLRIEVERNGSRATDSQRVLVSAGENVTVNFGTPAPVTATAQR